MLLNSFITWLQQLDFSSLVSGATIVCASLLCITFHETCHGFTAWKLGDPTAKNQGRLTLNPIRHVDIFGLLMMALFRFGWAKPVPVDPRYFKRPKRDMAITAAAGPLSNVVLAYLALLVRSVLIYVYYFCSDGAVIEWLLEFTADVAIISAGLAVFNIIPIPPLDGSKIVAMFLPDNFYNKLMRYERYGMILLMIVLVVGLLDTPLQFLRSGLLNGLSWAASFPFRLLYKLT